MDVMTAQVTDRLAGSQGALTLAFSHNCAAIKINITNDSGSDITVNSVAIEGVEYSGTLHDGTWTLSGNLNSSSANPFSLSYGSSIADGATADITGSSNIFIMLPQTLTSSAKLKMVTSDDTFETTISESWAAGKTYTYTITKTSDAIDLSMVDNAGNERSTMTTANCYLVHEAGDYKIPLVYGNSIKNGEVNTVAFYPGKDGSITNGTNRFVNHNNAGITGPWITKSGSGTDAGMGINVTSAELLWQDVSGLITAVSISGNYLKFTIGTFNGGNAVIAAKSGSTIVWSWHIWATNDDLSNTTLLATGSHNYTVASVNLGWVPTGGNGKQGYYPYFQWGRKDPFIPANSYNSTADHTVYNVNNEPITGVFFKNGTLSIGQSICYPMWFNYDTSSNYGPYNTKYGNMWDAQNTTVDNVATPTKKTVFDPCPPGFCVPTGNLFYYIGNNSSRTMSTWDSTNKGAIWNTGITGNALWFPAGGYRGYTKSQLGSVGSIGFYWSATPAEENRGRNLNFTSSKWNVYQNMKISGQAIRPVAEE